jgi:hypothetical protein
LLLPLVKGTLPTFTKADFGKSGKRSDVIATIVALGILRKKCGAQQGIWKMIEQKALRWLQGQGVDYEPLIARVIASLVD